MANRFLTKAANGLTQLVSAIASSGGAADADKIVATGADGKLDASLLPAAMSPETKAEYTASEDLAAGDLVYLDGAGVSKADSGAVATAADGYVLDATTTGSTVEVYFTGLNSALTGLTEGEIYFLSTAGAISTTPPAYNAGEICQVVGIANADGLVFELNPPVEYAG